MTHDGRTASLWFYIHPKRFFSKYYGCRQLIEALSSEYFWHDSFGKYWNRLIGCRIHGDKKTRHKKIRLLHDNNNKVVWYCFACERVIEL